MKRKHSLIVPLFLFIALSASASTGIDDFKFIEVKSFREESSLPPILMLTFEIDCGQEFVQVIRSEIVNPKTGKTEIAVGGLARDNSLSSCVGITREKTVAAGHTFSGREFEILKIKPNRPKVMKR